MAIVDDLREQLISRFHIKPTTSGWTRSHLTRWIEEAKSEHDPDLAWDQVLPHSGHFKAILLLAQIQYCDAQAVRDADRGISQSRAGADYEHGTDPWIKLADGIRKRYETLCNNLGIGLGGDASNAITVGEFHRIDPIDEHVYPRDTQPAPPSLVLSATVASSRVTLSWAEPRIQDFGRYRVFRHTAPGLKDLTTFTQTGFSGQLGVTENATHVADVWQRWYTSFLDPRDNSATLSSGTYYYLVVIEDKSGKQGYSNEVTVVVP